MATAYSQDLRRKTLKLIANGVSISEVSRLLEISRPTIYRWKEQLFTIGSTIPQKKNPPPQPSSIDDWEKFEEFVKINGDKTQQEMADLWGNVSRYAIGRGLKKLGYTRKKKLIVTKSVANKNEQILNEKIAQYKEEQIIYIDESGIDSNESYDYGWCQKGKRFHDTKPGKGRERLSIIGALNLDNFLAPMVYQGYCTAKLIETWLCSFLLPQVQPGQVIVMDNAPFHKSYKIRELIEKAGCELLFLPKYSPDLNPIEHWWHKIKTAIKKKLPLFDFNVHKAADSAFQYL